MTTPTRTHPPRWYRRHGIPQPIPAPNLTPPTRPPLLVGSAIQTNPREYFTDAITRVEKAFGGPLDVVRVYDSGNGLGYAMTKASLAGVDRRPVVMSWKEDPLSVLTGRSDAWYTALFKQAGPFHIFCFDHEQDAKEAAGQYTSADDIAAYRHLHDLWRLAGGKGRWIQIFTGYALDTRFAAEYVGDAYCDLVGVDPYARPGQSAVQLVSPMVQSIRRTTMRPVAVTEIGGAYTPQSPTFVASLADLRGLVQFVCWSNFEGTTPGRPGVVTDYRIDGDALLSSVFRGVRLTVKT